MGKVTAAKPKVGGAVSVAAIGTTLPTDATTALDAAFKGLGYIDEDGLTNSNSPEIETFKAWGGDTILTTPKSKEDTFSFRLVDVLDDEVLKLVYGSANVTGTLTAGITVKANNDSPEAHSFAIDMILADKVIKRIVIPSATVTDIGDVKYSDGELVGYDITITAVPDASGNTHYEYLKKTA